MTTLNQIAYNALNIIRAGRSTNNEYISLEQIKYNIEYYRALLIRRAIERGSWTREFEQEIVVSLDMVDPSEGLMMGIAAQMLRSDDPLPAPVRLDGREGITFVGKPDRSISFPIINYNAARWQKFNRFTGKHPKAFLMNGHLWIIHDKAVDAFNSVLLGESAYEEMDADSWMDANLDVVVRGIFEKPQHAHNYGKEEPDWSDDETPYPISLDMVQMITQSLIGGELQIMSVGRNNDREHDTLPDNNE
jgi:hypothetical protein